jgi:chaperone BCS1
MSRDISIFEEFLKISKAYFEKYSFDDNGDDKIKIYINNSEDSYFLFLGNRSKRSLDTIYLPKKQKESMMSDLNKFFKDETKKKYASLGINYKRTYLFEGVPGSGKTSFIIALASHYDAVVCIVTFGPKFTDNSFMTIMRNIIEVTEKKNKKTFLILEDIDCIFKERKSHDEQRTGITFSGLLNGLDGITTQENFICFITTNYKCNLDSALLRPGRIDYIMKFEYANKEQVFDIFRMYTSPDNNKHLEDKFYEALCKLNIKITTCLIQQYLMKYLDQPDLAIENIHEMKEMYQTCTINKEADETGLFS